jgi:predicted DNA-binding transcriptional regulator YafY
VSWQYCSFAAPLLPEGAELCDVLLEGYCGKRLFESVPTRLQMKHALQGVLEADVELKMAFRKAQELMRLAEMAGSRHRGICLNDVSEAFGVNNRTAQRMMREFEETFPAYICSTDDDRRRWWKLNDTTLTRMQGVRASELSALDMAIKRAHHDGAIMDVRGLQSLRDRLLACMPSSQARSTETDAEAILEAQGLACRPGPRAKIAPYILGVIAEGIKAPFSLELTYRGARDKEARTRKVEPYGLLLGTRQYLIARDIENERAYRRYRMDRIMSAQITGQSFARDPEFDLDAFAVQAFGSYHSDVEYGRVVWRFAPSAAPVAREFEFHPLQRVTDEPDGSLLVEFTASGWIEMAWHLYQWGDQVEVVAPEELRAMVDGFQRGDLGVLP